MIKNKIDVYSADTIYKFGNSGGGVAENFRPLITGNACFDSLNAYINNNEIFHCPSATGFVYNYFNLSYGLNSADNMTGAHPVIYVYLKLFWISLQLNFLV